LGDTFPYDAALFATGARPRRWTTIGSTTCDIKNALTLRDQLKAGVRSAVIGTGFIGLQVAACVKMWAAQWSCSKSLLSRSPASTETGAFVAKLHRRHGVDLGLNCSVRGIDNAVSALLANTAPGRSWTFHGRRSCRR
jgi:hypothetical protein